MELNREKLKRMFEDSKGNGGSANGGGGGGSLAGYATQAWVNEGFVSIDFFNRLFTVYGPGETSSDPDVVIAPNDLDSTINNIKAMFGLWTEQYLSALGLNPGGTGSATSLGMLDDVDITTPTNGQALVYNATSLKWENQTIQVGGDYLPLTGGTMTGAINFNWGTSQTDQFFTFADSSGNYAVRLGIRRPYDLYGATYAIGGNYYTLLHTGNVKTINGQSLFGSGDISVGGGASGNYLPLTGGTLVGPLDINVSGNNILKIKATNANAAVMLSYDSSNNHDFVLFNSSNYTYIEAPTTGNFTIGFRGGTYPLVLSTNGNVGIGISTPSYKLHVSGSIYATGAITALSDIKQKNVEQYDAHLGFEEVANAPVIKFTWKDPKAEDKGLQVGSIAQYWEKVLPEAVKKDREGTLSMSYGVVALVAAVSTAKKVQEHERLIADFERENKELKVRLRRLNRYGEQ